MIYLINFLKTIPDVIWSGLLASLITVSGVIASNISNTSRLKMQLQHDASEKSKERISVLRREVYLSMVEELTKANTHLASLPQIDITTTNLADGLQGFVSACARLQLVAEPKTALLVNQLSSEYGELFFKLLEHLVPVVDAKNDQNLADKFYNQTQAEITRLLVEMAKNNESGRPDQNVLQVLDANFKYQQRYAKQYSDERNAATIKFNEHSQNFHRQLFSYMRSISAKHVPVMVEIRRDLGLTGNLDEIEMHMQEQSLRMQMHYDNLLNNLNSKIQEDKSKP